jgi:rhodanese-related sulfurtransferase
MSLTTRLRRAFARPYGTVTATQARDLAHERRAALLAGHGHEVYDLRGGMRAWAEAGLPVKASGRTR